MQFKYLCVLLTIICGIFSGQTVFAGICNVNSNNSSSYTGTITGGSGNWTSTPTPTNAITFTGLVDCRNQLPDNLSNPKEASFSLTASNIKFSETKTYSGTTYYKISNTGDTYLDKYGYVSFSLRYSNNNGSTINKNLAENVILFTGTTSSPNYESATQGITIVNLKFYFTAAPAETINETITLGTVNLTTTWSGSGPHNGQQTVQINFSMAPVAGKTCSVNSPVVTLPTVSTSNLTTTGSEAGRTNFSITAACAGLANTLLYYTMFDNGDLANNGNILTNTNSNTSNVGIRVYDAISNNAISYNAELNFGTLGSGTSASVIRNFYAKYYKKDNAAVSAGAINAQATVLVVYK